MADNTVNNNRNATVNVNTSGETWLFTKNVTINVTNQHGIYEGNTPNTMTVLADINVSGASYNGINFQGSASAVSIGGLSVIDATDARAGIQYDGAGGHITVNGRIKGGDFGIHGNIWADVDINGKVSGNRAVAFDDAGSDITNNGIIRATNTGVLTGADGSLFVNGKHGEVHADVYGVSFTGMGNGVIVNKGLIESDNTAIESVGNATRITNTGRIIGDVLLGDQDDVFDTRNGQFVGTVKGGNDSDKYLISDIHTKIVENALDSGTDSIYVNKSYNLVANVENLYLRGGKDINGHGNAGDNYIVGNKGDNRISGAGGLDSLEGGLGNDILTGGTKADIFQFKDGYGKDTITDFTNGVDHILTPFVASQTDFDDLVNNNHIRQVGENGENLVIDFGGGDKLVLEHFQKVNLDYTDFL